MIHLLKNRIKQNDSICQAKYLINFSLKKEGFSFKKNLGDCKEVVSMSIATEP